MNDRMQIMGLYKKLSEFIGSNNSSYGSPHQEHMKYWIKKYDKDVLDIPIKKVDKELKMTKNNEATSVGTRAESKRGLGREGDS